MRAKARDAALAIASNRGPVSFSEGPNGRLIARRGGGGLVSGIGPLVAGGDATWVAAAMSAADRRAAAGGVVEAAGYRAQLLDIDPRTYELAYDVVSNSVLWFAHHGLWDLAREPSFDRGWDDAWAAYRAMNEAFANALAQCAPPGAVVLVQDYHLCLVGEILSRLRSDLRSVHFNHTPFAPPAWLRVLPPGSAAELLRGLAAYRACGFHTTRWAADFEACQAELAGRRGLSVFVAPLLADPDTTRETAASPDCAAALARLNERVGDRAVIGRVDRMELSKNLLRGFLAYEDLLERHPEHRERVVFVAGAYPSREGVPAYRAYRAEVEAAVDRINERFGDTGWDPVVLEVSDDHPRSVALLRRADVLLVNPIRDGMNLVAAEGALVGERDPVLCLSPEAGAFEHFAEAALAVPPFDVAGTAEVLHRSLTMPADERAWRAARLRVLAESRVPEHWLADQLAAAGGAQPAARG